MSAKAKNKAAKVKTSRPAAKAATNRKAAKAATEATGAGPKKLGMDSLIGRMKEITNLTKTDAANNVRGTLQAIREAMALMPDEPRQTVKLRVAQFGTFTIKPTEAHEGKNPKTGEVVAIPANYKLSFKPASDWKDALQAMSNDQLGI